MNGFVIINCDRSKIKTWLLIFQIGLGLARLRFGLGLSWVASHWFVLAKAPVAKFLIALSSNEKYWYLAEAKLTYTYTHSHMQMYISVVFINWNENKQKREKSLLVNKN